MGKSAGAAAHRADGAVAVDGAAAVLCDLRLSQVAAAGGVEGGHDALVPLRLLLVAARAVPQQCFSSAVTSWGSVSAAMLRRPTLQGRPARVHVAWTLQSISLGPATSLLAKAQAQRKFIPAAHQPSVLVNNWGQQVTFKRWLTVVTA